MKIKVFVSSEELREIVSAEVERRLKLEVKDHEWSINDQTIAFNNEGNEKVTATVEASYEISF